MSDSDTSGPSTPKKKRAIRNELTKTELKRTNRKLFRQEWLSEVPNDNTKYKCKACNVILSCGKSELEKHNEGKKHQANVKGLKGTYELNTLFSGSPKNSLEYKSKNQAKIAEIKISAFFAEHNIAFHLIDHLTPVFPDSQICRDIDLHHTKCTSIINNIIAPVEVSNLVDIIKNNHFSVSVDESTDISCHKFLCLLVRFVHSIDGIVHTKLLELVSIDAKDCSAKAIFAEFKQCLSDKNIPLDNIIGVACDGASVMVGKNNSFMTHITKESPDVITMRCICHSSALIASKATKQLPRSAEHLIRSVASYVSGSAKRCTQLNEIQDYFDGQRKQILKLADTRWLAMHQCVVRLIECWESLTQYFQIAIFEDKLKSAENVHAELLNPFTECYFYFLKFVLDYFNKFNSFFQSRSIVIYKLFSLSLSLIKSISQNFIKPKLINDNIFRIDFNNKVNQLPILELFVGTECQNVLNLQPENKIVLFKEKCLNFYIISAQEIVKRLPLDNELIHELTFIDPNIALDLENRKNLINFPFLISKFLKYINEDKLIEEWRQLPCEFNLKEIQRLKSLNILDMWHELSLVKDFVHDNPRFFNICKLAKLVLALPHSNAEAERIFSIVTDVKTKKRNRIGDKSLNSVAVIRSSFQDKNQNCISY